MNESVAGTGALHDVETLLGLRPLAIGDRVRVTPRLECRECWAGRDPEDGTPEQWDGVEGLVVAILDRRDTHPYVLHPRAVSRFGWSDWYFAYSEVERLPATGTAGEGREDGRNADPE